jgi:2-phosphosulfolactate phosphatase
VDPPADIVVVCAGRTQSPTYDDTLCAGYLVREIRQQSATMRTAVEYGEGALIAVAASADPQSHASLEDQLARSSAAAAIRRVGLEGDLAWCAAINVATVVPRMIGQEGDLLVIAAE